jgi:hypothetical protein
VSRQICPPWKNSAGNKSCQVSSLPALNKLDTGVRK